MNIYKSGEDYLEAILIIKKEKGFVKSVDIVNRLSHTKASVSVAMKALREEGYVTFDEKGSLDLTQKGMKIAKPIYERHEMIAKALISIGVSEETAYKDSCKIEHDISEESFNKLKSHLKKHLKQIINNRN